jgi:P-type conjugative transfer protein TrbG
MRWLRILSAALMLSGCTIERPPTPPASIPTPASIPIKVPAKLVSPSSPNSDQILAEQPLRVRYALKKHSRTGNWLIYKTERYVLYPYGVGLEPQVNCEPLRTTDIQLQAGETITDIAVGDAKRWTTKRASSGDRHKLVPHLVVVPRRSGIKTNLTIYTTKHTYRLMLHSRRPLTEEVEFYYPEEVLALMRAADAAAPKAEVQKATDPPNDNNAAKIAGVDSTKVDFSYKISGPDVPWKPLLAFNDKTRVYLQMQEKMTSYEGHAPALLIEENGHTQMVNYWAEGSYYIVDQLFKQAILVSDVEGQHDPVTISYVDTAVDTARNTDPITPFSSAKSAAAGVPPRLTHAPARLPTTSVTGPPGDGQSIRRKRSQNRDERRKP